MRIAIVVPSEQYLSLAGARIRYQRIAGRLAEFGHSLSMIQIAAFHQQLNLEHDVYVFSKCYDARSLITAHYLAARGRMVAVDLFDDYFSQRTDSRFVRHREWLRSIGSFCNFFLCSTSRMHQVVSAFMPGVPGHVLNDPFEVFYPDQVGERVRLKATAARDDRRIDVAWFGVGDNPTFPVGLSDLAAFGDVLSGIRARGLAVNLRILTNRRALTVDGLAAIGRLSVPVSVEEWTEEDEQELLSNSFLAFIPVNAQPFSTAKSLNRAVTALTAGAQVLSPGFPLYEALGDFIYRDPDQLVDDLLSNRLKVRPASLRALAKTLTVWGDPVCEAEKFGQFLTLLEQDYKPSDELADLVGLIHGHRSSTDCHKATQRLGYLSIGSPFSNPGLNYDVQYRVEDGGARVEFSAKAARHVSPRVARALEPTTSSASRPLLGCAVGDVLPGHPFGAYRMAGDKPASDAGVYAETIHLVRDVTSRLLPGIAIYLSESESPYFERYGEAGWVPPVTLASANETVA